MRHLTLLSMVFALLVIPSFAQEWRVELRSGPTAPWAAVGVYQTPEDAKQAFVGLPLGGTIEGRIVTVGTEVVPPVAAPVVAPPPVIVEEPVTTHPTWYRFGYPRPPLGFRYLHDKNHEKDEHRRPRPDTKKRPKYPPTKRTEKERREQRRREEARREAERRANERRRAEQRRREEARRQAEQRRREAERRQDDRRQNERRQAERRGDDRRVNNRRSQRRPEQRRSSNRGMRRRGSSRTHRSHRGGSSNRG